jgi:hypothetical protein
LGESIASTANFKVDPAITVTSEEVVFNDEVIWNVGEFDTDIFWICHGSVQIEVLDVNGAEAGTLSGENAVEETLDEFKRCSVGAHIAWVADSGTTNDDTGAIWIILFRANFANNHSVANLFALVGRDVCVVDEKECVSARNSLTRWGIANTTSLAEAAELVSIGCVPCGFVARVSTQLAMLEICPRCWIQDGEGSRAVNVLKGSTEVSKVCRISAVIMMALAAVLAAQHFPRKVDDWEGLPVTSHTWPAWKKAFRLAHLKRQRQIHASGGGEPLGGAHGVLPVIAPTVGSLEQALDNLALAATNDSAVLQQLTAANLALTATVTLLTAINKKLVDSAMRRGGTPAAAPAASLTVGGNRSTSKPYPGNYCWTHGHCASVTHTSATCANKSPGHRDDATAANTFGRNAKDKGWDSART